MSFKTFALSFCFISTLAFAQQPAQQTPAPGSVPGTTLIEPMLPYTPSLDVTAMDRSVDPCVDLYTYSCGGWQKKNPIPPDQVSWSVYGKLYQDNLVYLRGILEQAATAKDRDAVTQKIGDYYAACMDEAAVEKLGAKPLQPELDQIQALKSVREIAPLVAGMHLAGDSTMFRSGARAGPGQLRRHDRRGRPGRARTSRSRLLHQGRRQVEGDSRALRAACAEDVRAARRFAGRPRRKKRKR